MFILCTRDCETDPEKKLKSVIYFNFQQFQFIFKLLNLNKILQLRHKLVLIFFLTRELNLFNSENQINSQVLRGLLIMTDFVNLMMMCTVVELGNMCCS